MNEKVARKILRNRIICKKCGEIIESHYVHDFKQCSCGAVFVDGGHDYLRRGFRDSEDDFEELAEFEAINQSDHVSDKQC